jgi:hypothetical protein
MAERRQSSNVILRVVRTPHSQSQADEELLTINGGEAMIPFVPRRTVRTLGWLNQIALTGPLETVAGVA